MEVSDLVEQVQEFVLVAQVLNEAQKWEQVVAILHFFDSLLHFFTWVDSFVGVSAIGDCVQDLVDQVAYTCKQDRICSRMSHY